MDTFQRATELTSMWIMLVYHFGGDKGVTRLFRKHRKEIRKLVKQQAETAEPEDEGLVEPEATTAAEAAPAP